MADATRIFFDGGSRGNPGPAAGAAFTEAKGGLSKTIYLPHATNNEAEYQGLIAAVQLAREANLPAPFFLGDSKLVVSQVLGEWEAKSPQMAELLARVKVELRQISGWRIAWIPREENSMADRLANEAMDKHLGIVFIPVDEAALAREGLRPDIQKINQLGLKAGFNDLRKLKVGGLDEYSRMDLAKLSEIVTDTEFLLGAFQSRIKSDPAAKSLDDPARLKLSLNALRWTARGLLAELAIRKVLIDHETAMKMRDRK